jgi:hypothetical protein
MQAGLSPLLKQQSTPKDGLSRALSSFE